LDGCGRHKLHLAYPAHVDAQWRALRGGFLLPGMFVDTGAELSMCYTEGMV
jgi:hypothetical protein